jgi:hypothetical protein
MQLKSTQMKSPTEEEIKTLLDLLSLHGAVPNAKMLITLLSKPLLDTADMAVIFQKNKQTIRVWRRKGVLKSTEIRKHHYYKPESILELLGLDREHN